VAWVELTERGENSGGGSGGRRWGRRGSVVPWRRDGGGVRMNRQEKWLVVVLTEEGDQ
jgi:hypothetical protein